MLKRNRIFVTGGAPSTSSTLVEHLTDAKLRLLDTSKARELTEYKAEVDLDEVILSIGDYLRNRSEAPLV